jgi:nucleotidyltransferase/DNA polymerase involved in DNA repair
MSFAAIEAVDFPLAALRRLEAFPPDAPVALLSGESRKAVVSMVTGSARTAGVAAGMTAPQALAECADLRLRLRSPAA